MENSFGFDEPVANTSLADEHKNKNGSYPCVDCGKSYNTPSKLQRHVRVHSGEKPYSCDVCGRRFSRSDHVKQHMKTHSTQVKEKSMCHTEVEGEDGGPKRPEEGGDAGETKKQKAVKRKRQSEDGEAVSKGVGEGSTMVDTDENMFILQHALQSIKDEPQQFEFENLNGADIEALGDKALLEEISEHIDPEKGAMPVHMEAGTHQIDESHKVTEIVVFPKPGAKVTTYSQPVTAMTAYENKIIKNPNVPSKVEAKKLMGPASYKAKMKKKIEMSYPNPADKADLKNLVYNVGLDPNKVCVDSTDRVQEEINARNVAKKKESANKVTGKGMNKCEHCRIYFEDKAMSLLHGSLHNADDADPFTCKKCLKKLGNRLEFTAHLVWHLEPGMDG